MPHYGIAVSQGVYAWSWTQSSALRPNWNSLMAAVYLLADLTNSTLEVRWGLIWCTVWVLRVLCTVFRFPCLTASLILLPLNDLATVNGTVTKGSETKPTLNQLISTQDRKNSAAQCWQLSRRENMGEFLDYRYSIFWTQDWPLCSKHLWGQRKVNFDIMINIIVTPHQLCCVSPVSKT